TAAMPRLSILSYLAACLVLLFWLPLPLPAQTAAPPPKPTPEVQALLATAGQAYQRSHWQEALPLYEQALDRSSTLKDRTGEAQTLNNIGAVYSRIGQPQRALEHLEKALPIQKEVGDRQGEAGTLNNIGAVYYVIGQSQRALEIYEKALTICLE